MWLALYIFSLLFTDGKANVQGATLGRKFTPNTVAQNLSLFQRTLPLLVRTLVHLNSSCGADTTMDLLISKGGTGKGETTNTGLKHCSEITMFPALPLR